MPLAPGDMLLIAAALAVIAALADIISKRLLRRLRARRLRAWLADQQAAERKRAESEDLLHCLAAQRAASQRRREARVRAWLYTEWLAVHRAANQNQPERVTH